MRSFDVWWCSILKIISDLILALFGEFINKVERLLNFGTCIVMIVCQSLPDFSAFLQCQNLVEGFFFLIYLYVMCNITHVFSFVGFVSLLIDLQMSCPRSNSLHIACMETSIKLIRVGFIIQTAIPKGYARLFLSLLFLLLPTLKLWARAVYVKRIRYSIISDDMNLLEQPSKWIVCAGFFMLSI